jgi:hypothetical protein
VIVQPGRLAVLAGAERQEAGLNREELPRQGRRAAALRMAGSIRRSNAKHLDNLKTLLQASPRHRRRRHAAARK